MNDLRFKNGDSYKTSRVMYIFEALFEYLISILASGAFLAKLTTTIGISDSMTAILASITSLSSVFQIVSIYLSHKNPIKPIIIPMQVLSQLMYAGLYIVPLIGFKSGVVPVFCIVIVLANALKSIISPLKVNWFMSLVDAKKRGSYTAILQIVSVIGGTTFTLISSSAIDRFEAAGNMNGAYLTLALMIFVLIVLCNIPLFISREKHEVSERKTSPLRSIKQLFTNKAFVRSTSIFCLNSFAVTIGSAFLGTYQIKELGFSMTFIAIVDMIISVVRIIALAVVGRISFHRPYRSIIRFAYIMSIAAHATLMFAAPKNGMILFPMYLALNTIYSGSLAVSLNNFLFQICPPEERASALAIYTIMSGLTAFFTTIIATPFFDYIQKHGVTVFGHGIYTQQLFAAISVVIIILVNLLWNLSYKKLGCTERFD